MDCVCLLRKAFALERDAYEAEDRTSMPRVSPSRLSAAASGSPYLGPAPAFLIRPLTRQVVQQALALDAGNGRNLLLPGPGTTEPVECVQ